MGTATLAADVLTKAVVLAHSDALPVTVAGGFKLELVRNTGMSFSLFAQHSWVLTILASVVSVVVAVMLVTLPRAYQIPLAVLLAGSLGNLIDRARFGYVVDFIGVYWWPRFNVADAAIVIGAALVVLVALRRVARGPAHDGGPGAANQPSADDGDSGCPRS